MIELFETDIHEQNRASSKGNQLKWRKGEYWYKADYCGYEGLSETIISKLLRYSNIEGSLLVDYDVEEIVYKNKILMGCKSKNFLPKGSSLITLERLYKNKNGRSFYRDIYAIDEITSRIEFLVNQVKTLTGLSNFDKYLSLLLTVDAFFLNEDRHFHNIALIMNENGQFQLCPIFDNGAGLLSDFKMDYPLEQNPIDMIKEVSSKTICGNFDEQLDAVELLYGKQVSFHFTKGDIDKIVDSVEKYSIEEKERVKMVLFEQYRKYRYLFD